MIYDTPNTNSEGRIMFLELTLETRVYYKLLYHIERMPRNTAKMQKNVLICN